MDRGSVMKDRRTRQLEERRQQALARIAELGRMAQALQQEQQSAGRLLREIDAELLRLK
jgi:hypothetical protein